MGSRPQRSGADGPHILDRWREAAVVRASGYQKRQPWLGLVWEFGGRYSRLGGSVLVGHLTYRFFLWLLPLTLVTLALLGFASASDAELGDFGERLGLTPEFTQAIAEQARGRRLAGLIAGIFGLLWATYGLIKGLYFAYASAWEIDSTRPSQLLKAVPMTVVASLGTLVLVGLLASLSRSGLVLQLAGGIGTFVLNVAFLVAIGWLLPHRATSWTGLFPGALAGGCSFAALALVTEYYLPGRAEGASELYGTLGAAVATLFMLFLFAQVLVGAAFVDAVWHDRREILAG